MLDGPGRRRPALKSRPVPVAGHSESSKAARIESVGRSTAAAGPLARPKPAVMKSDGRPCGLVLLRIISVSICSGLTVAVTAKQRIYLLLVGHCIHVAAIGLLRAFGAVTKK